MTTLVGIVAKKGRPGIVLASDMIGTSESWDNRGDLQVRRQTQERFDKIFVNKKRNFAVAVAGHYDLDFRHFLYKTLHETDFEYIVQAKEFNALKELTLERAEGRVPKETNSLLVAAQINGTPRLYSCWPLGRVDEVPVATAIGSGSQYALEYLRNSLERTVPEETSLEDAILHAERAIGCAGADIHTKGFDFAVVTEDKIDHVGHRLRDAAHAAAEEELKKIIGLYK